MLTFADRACGDAFTDPGAGGATLLLEGGSNGGYFIVNPGADADVQLAYGRLGEWDWTDPFKVGPGNGVIQPGTIGIRFRNHVAGKTATVTAGLSTPVEPAVQLASAGVAAAVVSLPVILVNLSAVQSINSGAATVLVFNNVVSVNDPSGIFTLAGGAVKVNAGGIYQASLYVAGPVTAATRYTALCQTSAGEFCRDSLSGADANVSATGGAAVATGDSITGVYFQNSGGAINVGANLLVSKVG